MTRDHPLRVDGPDRVAAVVAVKALGLAKSRLALPPALRQALVLAFAEDTLTALAACPLVDGVVVVTADPVVAQRAGRHGATVVPDGAGGLDAAVATGARVAAMLHPEAGTLVVPGDLPCLRPVDVAEVLHRAHRSAGAVVPDRAGTGTTLLLHGPGRPVTSRYGEGSAARHAALGLRVLEDAPVRARHDVDTVEDLCAAADLGLGANTVALVGDRADDEDREVRLRSRRRQPTP